MSALLIDIPEADRISLIGKAVADTEYIDPLVHGLRSNTRCGNAGDISLAGAAGSRDQSMTVTHIQLHIHTLAICQTHIDLSVRIHCFIPVLSCLWIYMTNYNHPYYSA